MFRSTSFSKSHYAGKWELPGEDQRIELVDTNQLACAYGLAPDSPEKETMLLELLRRFHGYLTKYHVMIIRGTIPHENSAAAREAKEFLRTLAPRGSKPTPEQISSTCGMLQYAFKGCTKEEIYDTLAFCFMRAARKYDPEHTDKVKDVCDAIAVVTASAVRQFTATELGDRVGCDPAGILRALVRRGFLASVVGKKRKVLGYRTTENWPPPASFFQSGPIGFTYAVQMWFRYYCLIVASTCSFYLPNG